MVYRELIDVRNHLSFKQKFQLWHSAPSFPLPCSLDNPDFYTAAQIQNFFMGISFSLLAIGPIYGIITKMKRSRRAMGPQIPQRLADQAAAHVAMIGSDPALGPGPSCPMSPL